MRESPHGPWSLHVEEQTTITKETNYLCRSTGKPCVNATDLGYCKLTACSNSEAWNRRAET